MKIHEIITELRSNPEKNIKDAGANRTLQFLQGKDLSIYGISMTNLEKLGVNPTSKYSTPLGIYFYPAEYYVKTKSKREALPFQDRAEYIQIFKYSGNILDLSKVSGPDVYSLIKKLHDKSAQVASLLGVTEIVAKSKIVQAFNESKVESRVKTPAGNLWYVFWSLSYSASDTDEPTSRVSEVKRGAIVWNSLFRLMGIDGAIDRGESIIHDKEPYQGVIFNPLAVKLVKTIENIDPLPASVQPEQIEADNLIKSATMIPSTRTPTSILYVAEVTLDDDTIQVVKVWAEDANQYKEKLNNYIIGTTVRPPESVFTLRAKRQRPIKIKK